jgi:hypothetical protein
MSKVYIYVIDRDFGFAPNPFHGCCSLATCKPGIRGSAEIGDWVIGMGGARLKATGRCIFAMEVTEKLTFNEYWASRIYFDKRPVRNGSNKMLVGDNIYHRDSSNTKWCQEDSHHSNPDGTANIHNLHTDTKKDKVLISRKFFYFGKEAPVVPPQILKTIGYKNSRNYRVFDAGLCIALINWLKQFSRSFNQIQADPFDFDQSEKRYSAENNKIS